jgi:hypothetical protein
MAPSLIARHLVIAIYVIITQVSAKSYKNGSRFIIEFQNNSNTNTNYHHYGDTPKNYFKCTASSSLVRSERGNTRKYETKGIQTWKANVTNNKNGYHILRSALSQNAEEIPALIKTEQNKFYLFNHWEYRGRSKDPPNKKKKLLSTEDASAEQPVLMKILVEKMKLTLEHRLAANCQNASDSVQVPPVVRLLNYIAERYLYHCISLILYDDFYETQFHLLRALLSTYPLTYIHGKVGEQGQILDPPDMRCKNFLLLIKDLKMAQAVVGDDSISRVIVMSQASTWRIHEFLSSKLSRNLVNLLVIGNQNQVSHGSGIDSNENKYFHSTFWERHFLHYGISHDTVSRASFEKTE